MLYIDATCMQLGGLSPPPVASRDADGYDGPTILSVITAPDNSAAESDPHPMRQILPQPRKLCHRVTNPYPTIIIIKLGTSPFFLPAPSHHRLDTMSLVGSIKGDIPQQVRSLVSRSAQKGPFERPEVANIRRTLAFGRFGFLFYLLFFFIFYPPPPPLASRTKRTVNHPIFQQPPLLRAPPSDVGQDSEKRTLD